MQNGVPFIIHWDYSDKVLFVIGGHVLLVIITFVVVEFTVIFIFTCFIIKKYF